VLGVSARSDRDRREEATCGGDSVGTESGADHQVASFASRDRTAIQSGAAPGSPATRIQRRGDVNPAVLENPDIRRLSRYIECNRNRVADCGNDTFRIVDCLT
jgi:hypothetical protein